METWQITLEGTLYLAEVNISYFFEHQFTVQAGRYTENDGNTNDFRVEKCSNTILHDHDTHSLYDAYSVSRNDLKLKYAPHLWGPHQAPGGPLRFCKPCFEICCDKPCPRSASTGLWQFSDMQRTHVIEAEICLWYGFKLFLFLPNSLLQPSKLDKFMIRYHISSPY